MKFLRSYFAEFKILQRNIPAIVPTLFVIAVVAMNLLANKSVDTHTEWLALDCGIIFSWLTFLLMDITTKRYGPKAANMISLMALAVNLGIALMFFIASVIPGIWGESYVDGSETLINMAIDHTFGGTWYVLLGSSIAFITSAIVNNTLNWLIGKGFHKNTFFVFALRTYFSTFIGQFVDNIIFALLVSHHFFGWTLTQCVFCALTGAIAELICEVIFSPIGYHVSKKWEKENVGQVYLDYIAQQKGSLT